MNRKGKLKKNIQMMKCEYLWSGSFIKLNLTIIIIYFILKLLANISMSYEGVCLKCLSEMVV